MRVVLLHTAEALGPPEDPALAQIEAALGAGGHETSRLAVAGEVQPLVTELGGAAPDLVFNLAESFGGKSSLESNVAALLNLLGLRYTGSSPAGLILAGDKSLAKKVLRAHGVPTPEFATVYRGSVDWAGEVQFPLIVKPPQEDASLGIHEKSVVHDVRELLETMGSLQAEFGQPALVEQYVEGREFYVGVLGNAHARALPIVELDLSALPADRPRIASWEVKWAGEQGDLTPTRQTEAVLPTDLAPDLVERIQGVALDAFRALRLRDYARIDLRVTDEGEIYVIEVNPNCYLEADSEFAMAAEEDGLTFDELIARIVELALARYAR